jgi:hypothetical protein
VATVVISAYNVANTPDFGGHFWVYMQYAHGLRSLGCEVFWLERFGRENARNDAASAAATFFRRMERFGFGGRAILYEPVDGHERLRFLGMDEAGAERVFRRADLLLNFHYAIDPTLLGRFRRTALVDIDPGLLQFWISRGQLRVPPHDLNLTIGETVGTPAATFSDCGMSWTHTRPPVCLDLWPYSSAPGRRRRFTTVSSWLGGEYLTEGERVLLENDKRVSFLRFLDLPRRTTAELELSLYFKPAPNAPDAGDWALLESKGWRVRHARDVAGTPEAYRAYITASRGEFSCVKPSCLHFRNAWVSDRTLCYLASGKPAVVQDTGPSSFLPSGEGLIRFASVEEAAEALAAIEADYDHHRRAARAIAEEFFDARIVLAEALNAATARSRSSTSDSAREAPSTL